MSLDHQRLSHKGQIRLRSFRLLLVLLLGIALVALPWGVLAAAAEEQESVPPGEADEGRPPDASEEWWTQVQRQVGEAEYQISWQDQTRLSDLDAAWHAPNRSHGFRTYFTGAGPRVIPRMETEPSWEWGLALVGYGRGGQSRPVPAVSLQSVENRIDYERGVVTEWYENSPRGLKQGFVLWVRPEEVEGELSAGEPPRGPRAAQVEASRRSGLLHLDLRLLGTLEPTISADGQAVDFRTGRGVNAIHYAELKVTDARGRELPAWIEGFSGEGFGGLRIVFDDEAAAYPVTVDPLATTAAWTAEGDQGGARFGISVATAGDVNGDGYADVIVGANVYDNGQPAEGRAFVYHGSASGLATTAAWTAEGDQSFAEFARSVATAGDVNGDGYADVIVGASAYDNDLVNEGRAFLYFGNESAGLSLKPQQRRSTDAGPIAHLGASDSPDSFRLALLGHTPFGRGRVKLESEVKPLGTPFDGTGTQVTATWMDTGTAGAALNELATGLAAGTHHHWRVRLLYHPPTTPFQQASRWLTVPWNGWQEADLQTAGVPSGRIPNGADVPGSQLSVDKEAGGEITLSWGASCLLGDTDFEVYEGTLGDFTSHAAKFCTTGGATTKTFSPAAGSTYYLVVPRNASREGSYGTDSGVNERPQGGSACLVQSIDACL